MSANNLHPYRNTRDDLRFQFLGLTTLLRATVETTNGAFGLIEQQARCADRGDWRSRPPASGRPEGSFPTGCVIRLMRETERQRTRDEEQRPEPHDEERQRRF